VEDRARPRSRCGDRRRPSRGDRGVTGPSLAAWSALRAAGVGSSRSPGPARRPASPASSGNWMAVSSSKPQRCHARSRPSSKPVPLDPPRLGRNLRVGLVDPQISRRNRLDRQVVGFFQSSPCGQVDRLNDRTLQRGVSVTCARYPGFFVFACESSNRPAKVRSHEPHHHDDV
jgi:hypothetical protein